MENAVFETNFTNLGTLKRGKVRDVYQIDEKKMLIVATDRISAFDVIMNQPVPEKGRILNSISLFWFNKTQNIIKNHILEDKPETVLDLDESQKKIIEKRSVLVKKAKVFPVECVARGYIAGSGWKEYKSYSTICGIELPKGLLEFSKIPEPVFTPATKEDVGHDENINYQRMVNIIGKEYSEILRDKTLELYNFAANYLFNNGIILADTKFEFGIDDNGDVILIDEVLTPDSSRFWLLETYEAGKSQYNFDKQILRDYLETLDWNKKAPAPELPEEIIHRTLDKYKEAYRRVTGNIFE